MNFFFEKIRLIFDIENWLWKYNFGTFWGPGTMSIYKTQQFHLNTVDFWAKTLLFMTHQAKLHDLTDISTYDRNLRVLCIKVKCNLLIIRQTHQDTCALNCFAVLPPWDKSLSKSHLKWFWSMASFGGYAGNVYFLVLSKFKR